VKGSPDYVVEVVGIERSSLVEDGEEIVQRSDGAERRQVRGPSAPASERELEGGGEEFEGHLVAEELDREPSIGGSHSAGGVGQLAVDLEQSPDVEVLGQVGVALAALAPFSRRAARSRAFCSVRSLASRSR
jgi:hypothetical protein